MNSLNPFVPSITLIKAPRRDQRERFRKVVFGVLAAQLLFILALLLNHGQSEAASPEIAKPMVRKAMPPPKPGPIHIQGSSRSGDHTRNQARPIVSRINAQGSLARQGSRF